MHKLVKRKKYIQIITIIVALSILQCCKKEWQLAADEYIFVEAFHYRYGKIIEDNSNGRYLSTFCCPGYSFNPSSGTLEGYMEFPVSPDLKIIIGKGYMDDGDFGDQVSSSLGGRYIFPANESKIFKIEGIADGGAVLISGFGKEIGLLPGEEKRFNRTVDTIPFWGTLIMEVESSFRIKNHGVMHKSNVTKWQY